MTRVTIIGLGLIGGSIGLALKQVGNKQIEVVGHTRSKETSERALQRGAVDRTCWNINDAVENADLVIVATPVLAVKDVFQAIAEGLPEGCTVTDVSSTKAEVMHWAKSHLPSHVSFVGGHPMAGKEKAGINEADARLFSGCTYCIVPSANATDSAVDSVELLAKRVGAVPVFIEAEEHDGLVGGISHLPMLLATALVDCTMNSPAWQDMANLAATGYRDTSRLASGDPDMHYSIFRTNSESLSGWIDAAIEKLQSYQRLIEAGDEDLYRRLEDIKRMRDQWLDSRTLGSGSKMPGELQNSQDEMRRFLGGNLFSRRKEKQDK